MAITKKHEGNKLILALSGRLDTATSPLLQKELEFDAVKEIVLDFTELAYVSSAGLRVLLMGEKAAKAKGGAQTLVGVSAEIMEIFKMTGFADILTIQ